VIARKNLRKYLLLPALVLALAAPTNAGAAPKSVVVKPITKWSDGVGVELIASTNKAVVTARNISSATADIEIQARDFSGAPLWSKTIDSGLDELATTIAPDNQGNIWIAGNSAAPITADTATAGATGLNPDGVIIETPAPQRPDMRLLTLWKLNPLGEVQEKFTVTQNDISLVDAMAVSATGVSILASRESGPFVISTNAKGVFSKEIRIGTAKTKLSAIVRSSDGSISVFGSSSETLGGKKLVGREDGVLVKISKAGTVTSVVRSSAPKGYRKWSSATSTLFLTGSVKSGAVTESAITKFTNTFAPTWTTRITSTGTALATNGPNNSFYTILEPTAAIKGVSNFKAVKGQSLAIQFDSKGIIVGAFSGADLSQVKAVTYSLDGGLFILTENSIFKVGASK
jgi:hypothetical protein